MHTGGRGWACTYYEGHGHRHGSFGSQAVVFDVDAGGLRQFPQNLGGGNHAQFLADFFIRSSPCVIVWNVGSWMKRILAIYLILYIHVYKSQYICIFLQVITVQLLTYRFHRIYFLVSDIKIHVLLNRK